MTRFADLIDFTPCAALVVVSLAATIWISAQPIAFGSDSGWIALVRMALAAAGPGGT